MTPSDDNGRIKLSPVLAWSLILSMVGVGIAYGTLISGQSAIARDVSDVKADVSQINAALNERYYTAREIDDKFKQYELRVKELETRRR